MVDKKRYQLIVPTNMSDEDLAQIDTTNTEIVKSVNCPKNTAYLLDTWATINFDSRGNIVS